MATRTWFNGEWHEGNPKVIGPNSHVMWMSSCVFDGARRFEGVAPDLDRHCRRVVDSALKLGLRPVMDAGEIEALAREGFALFPDESALYVKPVIWAEEGFINPDPGSTTFALVLVEAPMPAFRGFSAMLSGFRRPTPETAPSTAKAACLYPNVGRALAQAGEAGFDNCVMLDANGNVAEFATANLFLVLDGELHTPVPNGTFLDGITRQRIISLMRNAGMTVVERTITWREVLEADEIFATGNFSKVMPCTRIQDRNLEIGPVTRRARSLYWDFAHGRISA